MIKADKPAHLCIDALLHPHTSIVLYHLDSVLLVPLILLVPLVSLLISVPSLAIVSLGAFPFPPFFFRLMFMTS